MRLELRRINGGAGRLEGHAAAVFKTVPVDRGWGKRRAERIPDVVFVGPPVETRDRAYARQCDIAVGVPVEREGREAALHVLEGVNDDAAADQRCVFDGVRLFGDDDLPLGWIGLLEIDCDDAAVWRIPFAPNKKARLVN